MKKIKYILPVIIILFTFFCSSAFAVDVYDTPSEPSQLRITSDGGQDNCSSHLITYDESSNVYYFYASTNNFVQPSNVTDSVRAWNYFIEYKYSPGDSDWQYVRVKGGSGYLSLNSDSKLIYCNHDIASGSGDGVFFCKTIIQPWGRIFRTEAPKVLTQILKILPIIAACLVGFLALRKAWATLLRVLRAA